MPTHKHIRCGVFLAIMSFFILHLLAFLLFVFSESFQNFFLNNKLLSYYSSYAFSGPYFSEINYIQATNKLYFQYKDGNGWSEFQNPEEQHFQDYHNNYLKLHSLKRSRLEKDLASNTFYEFYNSDSSGVSNLKKMHNYFVSNGFFGSQVPDSVVVLYLKAMPIFESPHKVEIDTLTYFKYSPLELE